MLRLTGTFLDEITHDIPSQNWGEAEWRREFAHMQRAGIDTVIIIRAGYQNKCIFPAKSVPGLLPIHDDLAGMFLDLAEEHGQRLFFGTFDSGSYWVRRTWWKEVDLNRAFIDEVVERYGHKKAFGGWYLCHETGRNDAHIIDLFREIGGHCRQALDRPVLISPYPMGTKQFGVGEAFTLEESFDHWNRIFSESAHVVDICAFQDGQIQYSELPEFHEGMAELGRRHGMTIWSNVETFDRDMPIKFPPADWRWLRLKMEEASRHAEKLISFELPHFMSPNSCWPSGQNLWRRYAEHHGMDA